MADVTLRQREVVRAISAFQAKNGFAPSIRELADLLGLAGLNGIAQHLTYLRRKGVVTWRPHQARTLAVTEAGRALL